MNVSLQREVRVPDTFTGRTTSGLTALIGLFFRAGCTNPGCGICAVCDDGKCFDCFYCFEGLRGFVLLRYYVIPWASFVLLVLFFGLSDQTRGNRGKGGRSGLLFLFWHTGWALSKIDLDG